MENPEKRIVFLHIPRTAGTTLQQIIERQYRPDQIFSLGLVVQEAIEEFKQLEEVRRVKIRMLMGHMGYGLHRYLPGPATYFTILRQPVELVTSFYYFIRRSPQHYLHEFLKSGNRSLKEYLESKVTYVTDNVQTRLLSGVWDTVPIGNCTPEVLERAKHNLREHFAVVGLTERFDETLLLLKRAFGWRNLFYTKRNVTRRRPKTGELPVSLREAITDANRLDLALYRYAEELFEEQAARQGASFAAEVRKFQIANTLLSPCTRYLRGLRRQFARLFGGT